MNLRIPFRFAMALSVLFFALFVPGVAAVHPADAPPGAELEFLSWSLPGAPAFLAVQDGTLYGGSNAFLVLDASEPSDLKLEGFLRPSEPGIPSSLVVEGKRAYVAWGGYGIRVVDLTDKAHPCLVSDNLDPALSY